MKTRERTRRQAHTILVVDEMEAVLAITREFLEASGYRILTTRSGSDAVQIAREHHGKIDVLITDKWTKGMSGYRLAKRVKGLRPVIGVIVMSAFFSGPDDRKKIEELEALFVWKPFTRRELLLKVKRLLVDRSERLSGLRAGR